MAFNQALFIYLAVLSLHCCTGSSLIVASGSYLLASRHYSLVVVPGLLIAGASLVAERGLWGTRASVVAASWLYSTGSVVVMHQLLGM